LIEAYGTERKVIEMAIQISNQSIEDFLPIGQRVRFESEGMGTWQYGTVEGHYATRHCQNKVVSIRHDDGQITDMPHWFVDAEDPRNSLVRKIA
jgi:hypothetical protein